jgi:hypothetical protein
MSAAKTLIPTTGPQKVVDQPVSDLGRALGLVERLADATQNGPARDPVRSAVVAALVVSGLLWGAHEALGGRAATERHERMNTRIEKLELQQTEIRIQLASIARAVGAEPVR